MPAPAILAVMGRLRPLRLIRDTFPVDPVLDTAVSRAVLLRVARGELPETMRLGRPGAMVAFGRRDVASHGYEAAVRAARSQGFEAVERLAGGRAAVYHEQTVAIAHAAPDRDAIPGTRARFDELAAIIAAALGSLGIDARVGEVAGEYCPGEHSVNARGATKLAGIGQRLIKGGAHLGAVVVAGGSDRIRDVLVPVYGALELEWEPSTVGSIEDELGAAGLEAAEAAILEQLATRYAVEEEPLDQATLTLAGVLAPQHASPTKSI
jgi:lipoate-protein ligase A